jgi:hypothetical protein
MLIDKKLFQAMTKYLSISVKFNVLMKANRNF